MNSDKGNRAKDYYEFTLISMVGTQLAVSIFLGFGFGYWLDTKFASKPLLMLLFGVFGIIAGFLNVYRTIKRKVEKE